MNRQMSLVLVLLSSIAACKGKGQDPQPGGAGPSSGSAAVGAGSAAVVPAPTPAVAWDPELKKLTDDFAACKEKNTNCEAYARLETLMEAVTDEAKKKANFDSMMACVDAGPAERVEACAYAAWAFSGWSYEAPKDPSYGKRLLAALRKLPTDDTTYAGSSVGQFLASWLKTGDAGLRSDLVKAIADRKLEKRGRHELLRLCGDECLAHKELFDVVIAVARDATEDAEARKQAMGVLWRVTDATNKKAVESLYVATMGNASEPPHLAMAAMQNLAYLASIDGYPKVIEAITAHAKDPNWVYYGGAALVTYLRAADLAIDHKVGTDVLVAVTADNSIEGSYRTSAIRALGYANDKRAAGALAKLAKDEDRGVAKAATDALAERKKREDSAKVAAGK